GGTTRVAKAVNTFGDTWNQDRSQQVNALQAQVNTLASEVKNLKAKIKKATDKKNKASLQAELNTAQSSLTSSTNELTTTKAASLKNETVNYLAKIYKVIQYFNEQSA
ncbi:MAG TPA: hypothetical protein VE973_00195, partial [Candidatus Limnocylindria bacterium]|nr:hypothetical protein [Candidatus Limnocylindria bacterium]